MIFLTIFQLSLTDFPKIFHNKLYFLLFSKYSRIAVLMPAVHSCRVRSARFSSDSYTRRDCASVSATLYTLALSFWFWRVTRGDSQARHKTRWLGHHGPQKKRELMRRDTSTWNYTRASKARRVFPSTFSHLRCPGFSRRECTASIRKIGVFLNVNWKSSNVVLLDSSWSSNSNRSIIKLSL